MCQHLNVLSAVINILIDYLIVLLPMTDLIINIRAYSVLDCAMSRGITRPESFDMIHCWHTAEILSSFILIGRIANPLTILALNI